MTNFISIVAFVISFAVFTAVMLVYFYFSWFRPDDLKRVAFSKYNLNRFFFSDFKRSLGYTWLVRIVSTLGLLFAIGIIVAAVATYLGLVANLVAGN